jgi:hypothetical protein
MMGSYSMKIRIKIISATKEVSKLFLNTLTNIEPQKMKKTVIRFGKTSKK